MYLFTSSFRGSAATVAIQFFAFKRIFPGLLRFARNDVLSSLFLIDFDDVSGGCVVLRRRR